MAKPAADRSNDKNPNTFRDHAAMKIDCIIKSGGIAPTDFSGIFVRIGAIIDVMSVAEPLLARPNWRMKGYTLEEAQARAVYAVDSGVNRTRLAELEDEYRGKDVSSIGIWLDGRREGLGASIEIMACGGTFPDTVSVDAGLSVILCSRHILVPRRTYASQTESHAGRVAGDSRRTAGAVRQRPNDGRSHQCRHVGTQESADRARPGW